ncbi:GntR family transcriptional regulator [Jiangella sp. DSM 45060]|uniref:GntR family transcriptional regulator n=1 Tax=Jiangella sp. DSM 45060 TaxID=1798224 RepID=UPI000879AA61|nr:GntR family transcriptional regulator [Jiangella sp. DSM 45060]SDT36357.1 Phage integrase family protein [Jiangella sp. DSM 45060]
MTARSAPRRRSRGQVEVLPSGALRVKVYAGRDPVSKRRFYLTETVPPGPKQEREAEQARTRLLNQVDEKRNPKTRATVDQLMVKYLDVLDVDVQTMRGYRSKYQNHIKPLIGSLPLNRLDVEVLDSFYSQLRTCRDHCRGRTYIQHRTDRTHQCDEHEGNRCPRNNPEGCRRCRRMCKPHVCKGLGNSTIRQIHWILSGALERAVVWKYLSVNPAEQADKPGLPTPNPQAPTVAESARLILAAWEDDPEWGALVWTKATTGSRRGEMLALRFSDRERRPDTTSVLKVERSIFINDDGLLEEKDTKTHQQRRIVLDPETDAVLDEVEDRARRRAALAGTDFDPNAYMFSPSPDGSIPLHPDSVSKRYARLARRLGIDTTLRNMRHYNVTELIMADVNIRTVAGRAGHSGGGTTTLRVYTAWSSEAAQRSAGILTPRMPPRPSSHEFEHDPAKGALPSPIDDDLQPYQRIAADLRGAIDSGILAPGDRLPPETALAARYGVAASTAHRAIAALVAAGLVSPARGKRPTLVISLAADASEESASVLQLRPHASTD